MLQPEGMFQVIMNAEETATVKNARWSTRKIKCCHSGRK